MSNQVKYRYRSSVTGKYVSKLYALGNERETYRVVAKPRGPNRPKAAPGPQPSPGHTDEAIEKPSEPGEVPTS